MDRIEYAKQKIREAIATSKVQEDPAHADNTLEWLIKFDPTADPAMQVAALAHDIDRAVEERKTRRSDFDDYDIFKAAHAQNGAKILREILDDCQVAKLIAEEACRLVTLHEVGETLVPTCSRTLIVFPILMSICLCITNVRAGMKRNVVVFGDIGGFLHEEKR